MIVSRGPERAPEFSGFSAEILLNTIMGWPQIFRGIGFLLFLIAFLIPDGLRYGLVISDKYLQLCNGHTNSKAKSCPGPDFWAEC